MASVNAGRGALWHRDAMTEISNRQPAKQPPDRAGALRGNGWRRWPAVFYAFVCAGIVGFVSGSGGPASSNGQSRDLTARLMSHAGGRWLVLLIGLGVAGAGIAMAVGGCAGRSASSCGWRR